MATTTGGVLARLKFDTVNAISTGLNVPIQVDIPSGGGTTTLANGTAASQINLGWADTRTLTATSVTLDVSALAAAATNTGAAAFTSITGVLIINNATVDSANNITVGNAATVQFPFNGVGSTSTVVIKPGGQYLYFDASTAGQVCTTNKNLKIDSGAGTASVTVVLVGRG